MKVIKIDEHGITIDNGARIEDYHNQDCCEAVYADWNALKDSNIMDFDFPENFTIEGVPNSGFRIGPYFVPCYDQQNGYYSSDLSLIITYPNRRTRIWDISRFCLEQH